MKRRPDGTIDLGALDPVVADAVQAGRDRQSMRGLSRQQRTKRAKDAGRNRRMFDISPELESWLEETAGRLSVPVSQLAEYLMRWAADRVQYAQLENDREPSRSMRFECNLPYRQREHKPP